jgi:hypothetical protein
MDVEAQIFMTDEDELVLLASLYMTRAKDILITLLTAEKTKEIFMEFTNDIKQKPGQLNLPAS